MYIFYLSTSSITASFRVPEMHTFHKTLLLPPRTTLIGMIGAAMGYSLEESQKYVEKNNILVAVSGTHKGKMNDLWNYRKITNKKYTSKDIEKRLHYSIVNREYLCFNNFVFFFGCDNLNIIENVRRSFHNPVFALSAGNSDDIIKIHKISDTKEVCTEKVDQFENVLLPFNIFNFYKLNIDLETNSIIDSLYIPQKFSLQTRFRFKDTKRIGVDRKEYTFVSTKIKLNTPVDGYIIDNMSVVLF